MLPDRVSNPGPLTYESGALPIALRGPALLRIQSALDSLNSDTELAYINNYSLDTVSASVNISVPMISNY